VVRRTTPNNGIDRSRASEFALVSLSVMCAARSSLSLGCDTKSREWLLWLLFEVHNPMFCHWYPTRVISSGDNVASSLGMAAQS
jgi:hypothetical protein